MGRKTLDGDRKGPINNINANVKQPQQQQHHQNVSFLHKSKKKISLSDGTMQECCLKVMLDQGLRRETHERHMRRKGLSDDDPESD